jgi:hypothetical protein
MASCCADVRGSEHHCPACHATFTCLTLFDKHQIVRYDRRPAVRCRPPEALGLVQDGRGTWGTPEGLARRQQTREQLAAASQRARA